MALLPVLDSVTCSQLSCPVLGMSTALSPVLGFGACCRLYYPSLTLMPVLSFHAWPRLYSLFFASVPVFSFVACPWLCCLFSALLPVRGFVACSRLCRLSSTFFPVLSILASLGFVVISYLGPHGPPSPPLQICANFAQNPGGGPHLLENVQKVLKGRPLLFFAN